MHTEQLTKQNMFSVLMYLFTNNMRKDCNKEFTQTELTNELKKQGFAAEAITKALNWLEKLVNQQHNILQNPPQTKSLRIFNEKECQKTDTESRSLIMRLGQAGLLTPVTRELIITQIMELDKTQIDLNQTKWVILMVLYNQPDKVNALLCAEYVITDKILKNRH